jgi:hypothetical protein
MNWIVLAQDRDRWQSLVNAVVNLRVKHSAPWNCAVAKLPHKTSNVAQHYSFDIKVLGKGKGKAVSTVTGLE